MESTYQRLVFGDQSPLNRIVSDRMALSGLRTQILKKPDLLRKRQFEAYSAVAKTFQRNSYNDTIERVCRLIISGFINSSSYNDYERIANSDINPDRLAYIVHRTHLELSRLLRYDNVGCIISDTGNDKLSAFMIGDEELEITWRESFFKFNDEITTFVVIPIRYIKRVIQFGFTHIPADVVNPEGMVEETIENAVLKMKNDFVHAFLAGIYACFHDVQVARMSKHMFQLLPKIKQFNEDDSLDNPSDQAKAFLGDDREVANLFSEIKFHPIFDIIDMWAHRLFNPLDLQKSFDYTDSEIEEFIEKFSSGSNPNIMIDKMEYLTSPAFTTNSIAFAFAMVKIFPYIFLSSILSRGTRTSMINKFIHYVKNAIRTLDARETTMIGRRCLDNLTSIIENYINVWEHNSHPMYLNEDNIIFLNRAISEAER